MTSIGQTAVVNAALVRLGSKTKLTAVDDSHPIGRKAGIEWPLALESLAEDHPWNPFIARAQLNSAGAPEFGWDSQFTLPADCLRWLPPVRNDDDYFEGVQEGDKILCNEAEPLPVRYISRTATEDMTRWSAKFREAMVFEMAARLAETVTQSESIKQDMVEAAARALSAAKRRDGQASGTQRQSSVSRRSNWLGSRDRSYQFGGR